MKRNEKENLKAPCQVLFINVKNRNRAAVLSVILFCIFFLSFLLTDNVSRFFCCITIIIILWIIKTELRN